MAVKLKLKKRIEGDGVMSIFKLDRAHSEVTFQVKHLMVSKVRGEFEDFDVQLEGDLYNLEELKVDVTIQAATINTNNEDRDGHLRSGDFFETETFPEIKIVGESMTKVDDDEYELLANVTIKDVTRQEKFEVEYNGQAKNPMDGSIVTGFEVKGKINREDFGLTWNAALETGGVMVGKDVKLKANLEFVVEE